MAKMAGAKLAGIVLVVAAMAMAAIALAPGWGLGKTGSKRASDLANSDPPSLAKNEAEMRILSVLDDIRQGPWMANVDPRHGRLLRILAESTKAKQVVEIGTSNGYSGLWLCLGLKAAGGKLVTFDIDHEKVLLARANFKRAGVENLVTVIEGDAHRMVSQLKEPIDILFIDADKEGYLDYLNQLLPLVRPGGLILADNMSRPTPSPSSSRPSPAILTSRPSSSTCNPRGSA